MDKRFLGFLFASMAVFFVWFMVIVPRLYPPPPPKPPAPPPVSNGAPPVTPTPTPDPDAEPFIPADQPNRRVTWFERPAIKVKFDNRGARITELLILHKGREWIPLLPPENPDDTAGPGACVLESMDKRERLAERRWNAEEKDGVIAFSTTLSNGVSVEKTFTLRDPDPAKGGVTRIDVALELRNPTAEARTLRLRWDLFDGIEHDGAYKYDEYLMAVLAKRDKENALTTHVYPWMRAKPKGESQTPSRGFDKEWVALRNRYFALTAWPQESTDLKRVQHVQLAGAERWSRRDIGREDPVKRKNIQLQLKLKPIELGPEKSAGMKLSLLPSALDEAALAAESRNVEMLVDYAGFNVVGRFLLWLLNAFYGLFHNYGVAVLLLTITVRLCLFPLSMKSQTSMAAMQKIQPKMNQIRQLYKDNPQKMQAETMKLMKENHVSYTSGCLPIFLQFPIFIGMYSVLNIALDLRHTEFVGWIHDLSQPDRLVTFPSPVGIFGLTIESLNLLPIMMTVAWVVQGLLTPLSEDPQMRMNQRMMRYMPVLFGFICYTLASGLSLYLFVNSLLAIVEQKTIKKYFLKPQG